MYTAEGNQANTKGAERWRTHDSDSAREAPGTIVTPPAGT